MDLHVKCIPFSSLLAARSAQAATSARLLRTFAPSANLPSAAHAKTAATERGQKHRTEWREPQSWGDGKRTTHVIGARGVLMAFNLPGVALPSDIGRGAKSTPTT